MNDLNALQAEMNQKGITIKQFFDENKGFNHATESQKKKIIKSYRQKIKAMPTQKNNSSSKARALPKKRKRLSLRNKKILLITLIFLLVGGFVFGLVTAVSKAKTNEAAAIEEQVPEVRVEKPQEPEPIPTLDSPERVMSSKYSENITEIQWFIYVLAAVGLIGLILDRVEAKRPTDSFVLLTSVMLTLAIKDSRIMLVTVPLALAYSAYIKDWSLAASYCIATALIGGYLFNTLGAFESHFGLQAAPLLPLKETIYHLSIKNTSYAGYSIAFYALLLTGVILYVIELVRDNISRLAFLGAGIAVYITLRVVSTHNTEPAWIYFSNNPLVLALIIIGLVTVIAKALKMKAWDIMSSLADIGVFFAVALGTR